MLDIDSPIIARFDEEDKQGLCEAAKITERMAGSICVVSIETKGREQ